MGEKNDLTDFINSVNRKYPLEFAVLFGSRARGDELESSDYDILLVSKHFKGDIFSRIGNVISMWHGKNTVEPICFSFSEFKQRLGEYNAIIWESLKDGKVVYGREKFKKYKARFLEAVRKKEITVTDVIRFNVPPETIFPS